jgi:hypothetical protein
VTKKARGAAGLHPHGELHRPRHGDRLVTVSAGPHDEAVALWVDADDLPALLGRDTIPGGASFPRTLVRNPPPVRITTQGSAGPVTVALDALDIAFPTVQPLPGGRFAIVGSRCQWRPEGPDRNAIVVDRDGTVLARTTVGDGIQHALATPSGRLWLGFFDEGVLGNLGWAHPGPEPLGSHGLVRLDPSLATEWRFPSGTPFDDILDCYALNVAGEDAWACYYTSFTIVCIRGDEVSGWSNDVRGAQALITDGRHVALVGGYEKDRDRVVVGSLTGGRFVADATRRLTLPGHHTMPSVTLVGRGGTLHAFVDERWYQLDLGDLVT